MKPLTVEWVEKAEGDYITANREYRARKTPNYDAACFHCQQCAEKYLKALLQEADIPFGKTHNLIGLLDLLLPIDSSWDLLRTDLQALGVFAVYVRYPGTKANKQIAQEALRLCRTVRNKARAALGLEP